MWLVQACTMLASCNSTPACNQPAPSCTAPATPSACQQCSPSHATSQAQSAASHQQASPATPGSPFQHTECLQEEEDNLSTCSSSVTSSCSSVWHSQAALQHQPLADWSAADLTDHLLQLDAPVGCSRVASTSSCCGDAPCGMHAGWARGSSEPAAGAAVSSSEADCTAPAQHYLFPALSVRSTSASSLAPSSLSASTACSLPDEELQGLCEECEHMSWPAAACCGQTAVKPWSSWLTEGMEAVSQSRKRSRVDTWPHGAHRGRADVCGDESGRWSGAPSGTAQLAVSC